MIIKLLLFLKGNQLLRTYGPTLIIEKSVYNHIHPKAFLNVLNELYFILWFVVKSPVIFSSINSRYHEYWIRLDIKKKLSWLLVKISIVEIQLIHPLIVFLLSINLWVQCTFWTFYLFRPVRAKYIFIFIMYNFIPNLSYSALSSLNSTQSIPLFPYYLNIQQTNK